MLSKEMEKALNDQINEEGYAAHYYLSMASWCDKNGLQGSAKFMYLHGEKERIHMMKLLHYVNDTGGHSRVGAIKEPPHEFKSLAHLFDLTLKHEQNVTKKINALVDKCLAAKDHSTFNFLQWYVAEQHEEEHMFKTILDLIKITGLEGRGLFLVDKEIGSLTEKTGSAA
ncbi:MAG TPA: ferritin [bacterium]|nr:ferritin [bacterium]